jgi:hypothetical protein
MSKTSGWRIDEEEVCVAAGIVDGAKPRSSSPQAYE